MISKEKKKQIVSQLLKEIPQVKGIYFTNIQGVDTKSLNAFRQQLKEKKGRAQLVKKNLIRIALNRLGFNYDWDNFLQGSILVHFAYEDFVTIAQLLRKFKQKNENFQILGGIIENRIISPQEVLTIATLPSYEVLWGRLGGVLLSPLRRLTYSLKYPIQKLVLGVHSLAKNK